MHQLISFPIKKYFYLATAVLCLWQVPGLAQNVAEQKTGPNMIQNPGFEQGAANWHIGKNTAKVVTDEAHSGTHSLYYTNTNPKSYKMFGQKLDVKAGQHIQFSAWVKGKNVGTKGSSQGASLYVQSYEQEKYLGGSFPHSLIGTFDWTQIKGTYTVPASATSTSVGLYLRKGITGMVWFDDVEVRVQFPVEFQSFLTVPNYRGMIRKDDNSPWKLKVKVNRQPDWKTGSITIKNILTDNQGKVLLSKRFEVAGKDTEVNLTFAPPTELALGNYSLTQTITNPNGEVSITKKHPIHVVAKMPKVYIDKDGFTVVNGKRFFPLGLYLSPTTDEEMERVSKGGFNTILSYSYGRSKDPKAFLDRAAKHNLKVVYSLKDMYPGKSGYDDNAFQVAADYTQKVKDKPALLAWYTNDELNLNWLPKLKKMYNQVKELDPNHPTFQVLYQMDIMPKYFDVTDILGADPYPVGSADLTKTATNTRITMAASHGANGVWIVPQLMDWAIYHEDRKQHPPSLDEMRNQAYQAIINGATGLIWYQYYDMMFEKYPRGESTKNMTLFNKRWKDAAKMAHEIDAITPAILHGSKVALNLPKDAKVEAGALQYKNQLLVMLANPYYEEENVSFALPKGWKIKKANQGDIKSTSDGGKVTFTLPSVGSGVFRLVNN